MNKNIKNNLQDNIKNVHHVGVIVQDMEKSLPFYTDILGFTIVDDYTNEGMQVSELVCHENALLHVVFMSVYGGKTLFELLEYKNPRAEDLNKNWCNNDFGIRHVTFEVEDCFGLYEKLCPLGVEFMAPPQKLPEGNTVVYFKDYEGNILEFYQPAPMI